MAIKKCDIWDCPQFKNGECELSINHNKEDKEHGDYTDPSRCTHYKFKHRNDKK